MKAKTLIKLLLLGSLAVVAGCLLSGCAGGGTSADTSDTDIPTQPATDTDAPAAPVTEPVSEAPTETPAEEPTDAPTEADTSVPEDPALNVFPTEGQNIEIGIFYDPPVELAENENYNLEEQYDRIRDANITFIEMTNPRAHRTTEDDELTHRLAAERGILTSWLPGNKGENFLGWSDERLRAYFAELAQDDTIVGVHIVDEPSNPVAFSRIVAICKQEGLTPRLNYLPSFATWVFENYQGHIEDPIIAAGRENWGYLSYDQYPFPYSGGQPSGMYANLEQIRVTGLRQDVPTAFYIQSIGEHGNFRRTNADEIRFHISAGLAYGIKSYTYFTWWTTGFCDPADYGIISPYGEKTDIYDGVAAVNADVLKVGRLLYRLDALEVYHSSGREDGVVTLKKTGAPLAPAGSDRFIVSYMQDRETDRDYIMLVNKSYTKEVTSVFTVSDAITHLYNCTNGVYEELDISAGSIELTFAKGGFILLACGQHDNIVEKKDADAHNIAEGKRVFCDDVNPGSGYYAYCVTDGLSDASNGAAKGYRSSREAAVIGVDLGSERVFNRIDIYPTDVPENFPTVYTVEVSSDGENWVQVGCESDAAGVVIPSFTFDAVTARYVRLNAQAGSGSGWEIAEIEVFSDDGSLPAPGEA